MKTTLKKRIYYYVTAALLSHMTIMSCRAESISMANKVDLMQEEPMVIINSIFSDAIRDYDELSSFRRGFARVKKNDKWGIIDHTGKVIVPCVYDDIYGIYDVRCAIVIKDGKYGMLNTSGEKIVECTCDELSYRGHGLFDAKKGDKYGILDAAGNAIVPYEYDSRISSFSEGLAQIKKTVKMDLLMRQEKWLFHVPTRC